MDKSWVLCFSTYSLQNSKTDKINQLDRTYLLAIFINIFFHL